MDELEREATQPSGAGSLLALMTDLARRESAFAAARHRLAFGLSREWEITYGVSAAEVSNVQIRALRAEVAAAHSISENEAGTLLRTAEVLVRDLPRTLDELEEGRFSDRHARLIADAARSLPAEAVASFEDQVLPHAYGNTIPRFARHVRMLVARLTAATAAERHAEALTRRGIWLEPEGEGMVLVMQRTSAENGVAVLDRLTRIGKPIAASDGEDRTLDQVMSDVMTDLLLDEGAVLPATGGGELRAPALHRGVLPQVHVTVPVLTALGRSDEPGELDGYGPIDAETARRVAGTASGFYRVLTDPESGVVLSVGRRQYEVPAPLRRYLQLRDGTCRFVGCNRQAKYSDVDHTVAWQDGGETSATNLAHLCRGHHRMKHATGWQVEQPPGGNGELKWKSPIGHGYRTRPRTEEPRTMAMTEWLQEDSAPF